MISFGTSLSIRIAFELIKREGKGKKEETAVNKKWGAKEEEKEEKEEKKEAIQTETQKSGVVSYIAKKKEKNETIKKKREKDSWDSFLIYTQTGAL